MPEGAIYVGRPTEDGNRYIVGEKIEHVDGKTHYVTDNAEAKKLYMEWVIWQCERFPGWRNVIKNDLGGHDLCCWCGLDQPCHADVLLEIANS